MRRTSPRLATIRMPRPDRRHQQTMPLLPPPAAHLGPLPLARKRTVIPTMSIASVTTSPSIQLFAQHAGKKYCAKALRGVFGIGLESGNFRSRS